MSKECRHGARQTGDVPCGQCVMDELHPQEDKRVTWLKLPPNLDPWWMFCTFMIFAVVFGAFSLGIWVGKMLP